MTLELTGKSLATRACLNNSKEDVVAGSWSNRQLQQHFAQLRTSHYYLFSCLTVFIVLWSHCAALSAPTNFQLAPYSIYNFAFKP